MCRVAFFERHVSGVHTSSTPEQLVTSMWLRACNLFDTQVSSIMFGIPVHHSQKVLDKYFGKNFPRITVCSNFLLRFAGFGSQCLGRFPKHGSSPRLSSSHTSQDPRHRRSARVSWRQEFEQGATYSKHIHCRNGLKFWTVAPRPSSSPSAPLPKARI